MENADFYLLYTIAFAGIALFLYMRFYLNGKSLIWSHDGVPQHRIHLRITEDISEKFCTPCL